MLTNPYFIAVAIPLLLLLSGALAKKLVRGPGFTRHDFFLGIEFTLAALSAALIHLSDGLKDLSQKSSDFSLDLSKQLSATSGFIAITFFLLMWVLSTHQDWGPRDMEPRGQILWLGIGTNLVGAGLIASFILIIKGIQ